MNNREDIKNNKISKFPIILIIILVLVIIGVVCISIFYKPNDSKKDNDTSNLQNEQLDNESVDEVDIDNWENDTKYIKSIIDTNEMYVMSNIETDYKLDDICLGTSYNSPTNITNYFTASLSNIKSSMTIGCYKENDSKFVLLIPSNYNNNKYVKKINFILDSKNIYMYDFGDIGDKVICSVDPNGIISCVG